MHVRPCLCGLSPIPALPPARACRPPPAPLAPCCSIYERALAYVASDWNAHTLWDKYLAWEAGNGSSQAVAALHRRVLSCPIKELDRLYAGCKDYARVRTPGELVSAAQLEQLRVAAEARRASKAAAAAGGDADVAMSEAAATAAAAPAEAPRGLEEQGSVGGERAPGDDDVSAGPSEDDVLRAEWLQQCEQQYQVRGAEHAHGCTACAGAMCQAICQAICRACR